MSEPTKENPKTSKRSRRKPAMEPLGWDEIVSQPGMGGYLSFLNGPVPLPHLQGSAPGIAPDPGPVSAPQIDTAPEVISDPLPLATPESALDPGFTQMARIEATPEFPVPPVTNTTPGVDIQSGDIVAPGSVHGPNAINDLGFVCSEPEVVSTPPPVSIPAIPTGRIRIRRCAATYDGHS